jgi:hypothetical protein
MTRDDYTKRIAAFLEERGVTQYRFEHRRKHRAVIIPGNRPVFFSTSGSDRRGPRNTIAILKRAIAA